MLVSGVAGIDGDLVEQLKDSCGYVVRGVDWVLEQVGIHLLDRLFEALAGDFSTVSVIAEDWRRTVLAAGILADNYRTVAAAVPAVWTGDAADEMTLRMEEFGDSLDVAAACIQMVQMTIDDMLASTKAATELLAMTLSPIDDLCMWFASSAMKLAKDCSRCTFLAGEIFTGGRRIREIIRLAREVIRTPEALADLVPALTRTAAAVAVTLHGLDFAVDGANWTKNAEVGRRADDVSHHLPDFPRGDQR